MKISFKKSQSKADILKKVSEVSINERQCVAIICFERYCRKNKIVHKDIEVFIEHVWKVVQIEKNFCEWIEKFGQLAITGQGDPFPEDLIKVIPTDLLDEEKFDYYYGDTWIKFVEWSKLYQLSEIVS